MFRIYDEKIQKWLETSKKALLIYGARQVGKTYLIREVLKRNNVAYCEFNLVEREDVLESIKNLSSAEDISDRLAMYSNVPLEVNKSIIFLDEIQKYPEIITKIKFLVDEGKYRYILSGSNLGVELKGIKSVPVGYMDSVKMFPLTFYEFALASGVRQEYFDHIRNCFEQKKPVDGIIHNKFVQAFYYYLVVGGMPAVINVFNETHSLEKIDAEQKSIIAQYKADFTKYELENKRLKVVSIYDNIPAQLNKQNRKFTFTMLDRELKFDRYEESFLWLQDAAVAIPAYIVQEPKDPLKISKETNTFKLFMSDVGLLTSCYPSNIKKELLEMNPERKINNGALFENFVAQEIYAQTSEAYYYKKNGVGEVDFIAETDEGAVPVEVKSGKDFKKHSALDHLLEKYDFSNVYVASLNNLETDGKIVYLPIYMIECIFQSSGKQEDFIPPLG